LKIASDKKKGEIPIKISPLKTIILHPKRTNGNEPHGALQQPLLRGVALGRQPRGPLGPHRNVLPERPVPGARGVQKHCGKGNPSLPMMLSDGWPSPLQNR
jgi:hypothetical protein